MTDNPLYAGLSATEDDDVEADPFALTIDFDQTGDKNSGYHTFNDPRPGHQWHREDVTQRKGTFFIRCNMVDVVHGKWEPDSDEYASIIVFLFRFDATKNSRHISKADMTINFRAGADEDEYSRPEVMAISFDDSLSLVEQEQSESTTRGAEGTAGLTGVQLAELSGKLKWEQTVSRVTTSYTKVIGSMFREGYSFGADNQVQWTLLENKELGTGVPVAFRAGILLKRPDQTPFQCDVQIEVEAGLRNALKNFFGGTKEKDDSVLFDPTKEVKRRTRIVKDYDPDNLSAFDLQSISDVTFLQYNSSAVKGKEATTTST